MNIEQIVRNREAAELADKEQPELTEAEAEALHLDEEIEAYRGRRGQSILRAVRCAIALLILIGLVTCTPIGSLADMLAPGKHGPGQTTALDWVFALLVAVAPIYGIVRYCAQYASLTKELNALEARRNLLDDGAGRELRKREALRKALESRNR